MAGGTRRGVLGLMAAGWLSSGCMMAPPEEAEARLEELRAEEERMDAALDEVESRLLWSQSRVHLWQELGRRHQEVSAIQCRVSEQHLEGIARHLEKQEERARKLRRRRRMAAMDATVLTSGKAERRSSN
ncbi:MAG TPA: hypothetical protein VLQ93_24720 [Myxococcaceae bacterium]|nr:hypothetical protein [Myxococcaceae bacterium]